MKPSDIARTIKENAEIGLATLVLGAPGGGKTAMANDLAAETRRPYFQLNPAESEKTDFTGIPFKIEGQPFYEFLPRAALTALADVPHVINIDELDKCQDPEVTSAMARLFHPGERTLGPIKVHPESIVMGTANEPKHRTGGVKIFSHILNRVASVQWEIDTADWLAIALAKGFHMDVVNFIRRFPKYVNGFDPAASVSSTPRSLEFLARMAGQHTPPHLRLDRYSSVVGLPCAQDFLDFIKLRDEIPAPSEILANPDGCRVPADPGALYALSGLLVMTANDLNFNKIIRYSERLPSAFNVRTVRDAIRRDDGRKARGESMLGLANCREYVAWESKHQDVLN